jgi:DNA-binding MarR family transcriptional regulator
MDAPETAAALTETWSAITRAVASPALLERVRQFSGIELHRSALFTLWRLANLGPQQVSELANGVDVDVSTMSRLVRQLERDGLVARARHDLDQRCVLITITEAGERAHQRVAAARTALLMEVVADWRQADRDTFVKLLARFAAGLVEHIERPLAEPVALAGR